MLNIVHVVPRLRIGGIRTYIHHLAGAEQGSVQHSVISIFDTTDQHEPLPGVTSYCLGVHLEEYGDRRRISELLRQSFDRLEADLVHSHHLYTDIYALPAVAQSRSLRAVRTIHGILQVTPDDGFTKTGVRYGWSRPEISEELALDPLCSRTFCVSSHLGKLVASYGLRPETTRILHNAVNVTSLQPSSPTERRVCRQFRGVSEGTLVLGFLGRAEPCKNLIAMAHVANILAAGPLPNVRLHVQALGPSMDAFVREINRLGLGDRITYQSHDEDIRRFFSLIDILLLPSLTEACPYVVLEAMASGIPVVAARVGGLPEIIQDDVSGVLVESPEPCLLAQGVMSLTDAQRRDVMGQHSRAIAEGRFGLGSWLRDMYSEYHEVTSTRAAR